MPDVLPPILDMHQSGTCHAKNRLIQIKATWPICFNAGFEIPVLSLEIGTAKMKRIPGQVAVTLLVVTQAMAASPAEQRGKTFAMTNCARCHSIDRVTQSPLRIAPPFRTLHDRYPVETLAEAFAEGIYTGHPTMPAFQLDPDQIHDLLSFLKSLE